MVKYSTALSHIFLAGTSLYCFKALRSFGLPFCKLSYAVLAIHSLLGIWRWGNPRYGYQIDKIYRTTGKMEDLLVLPCIVTTIWLKYNYSLNFACAHMIVSLIPLFFYIYDNRKHEPIDAFLAGNLLSLFVVSCYNNNEFGITTSLSYLMSYFMIKRDVIHMTFDVPTQDLFNYSMCFFAFFGLKAILEPVY